MERETPYQCRHCKQPLGYSSDKSLSLNVVKITQPVKMQCGKCGRQVTWRPAVKEEEEDYAFDTP